MKYLLALLSLSVSIITNAQSLSKEQIKQVNIIVDAYKQNLITYSISGGKDNIKLFKLIKSYFPRPTPRDAHVLDIGDLYEGGAENTDLDTYLNKIADDYHNSLSTVFTSGRLLNCILNVENEQAAVYVLNKTVDYKGKVYVATNVVTISLPQKPKDSKNYKILSVQSATYFINKYKNYNCTNMVEFRHSDMEKLKMLYDADTLFRNSLNTERALIKYIHLAERYPNDSYIKMTMDTCIKSIRDTFFLVKRGDSMLKKQDFGQALYWYRWHQKIKLIKGDSNEVEEKIKSVIERSDGTLYSIARTRAEQAYNDKNWPEARFHLEQALDFKPNDKFALELLKSVKNYDETEYSREIGIATRMFDKDETANAPEYYQLLKNHDTYHPLSTTQYIKMCLILYTKRVPMKKEERLADLKTYCKKLNDSLSSETDEHILKTAERLINSIIGYN